MRCLISKFLKSAGLACAGMSLAAFATTAPAMVIYQAFDLKFADVEGKLDHLKAVGFDTIQVSPPAKSADLTVWWARYQPLDLTVLESPLGTEDDLKSLIDAAHARGLKVLIDTVLNHMADPKYNGNSMQYAQFAPKDFHFAATRPCIQDYNNRYQVTNYWICDPVLNNDLPDLDTSSPYVRSVHKAYLQKLLGLGADGFRFDAAKHIEPEYWQAMLPTIPAGLFRYGEVIGQNAQEYQSYTPLMPVTDFQLLGTMISAFSLSGDLRSLISPGAGAALPGDSNVVFARDHDTAMHSDFYNFGDLRDAILATTFVVARGVGTPVIYRDDAEDPTVQQSITFHNMMAGNSTYVRRADEVCTTNCDPRTLLFIERGTQGMEILNTANNWVDAPSAVMPGLPSGCYKDLANGFPVVISVGGDGQRWITEWGSTRRGGLNIGPRTALFLTRHPDADCHGAR